MQNSRSNQLVQPNGGQEQQADIAIDGEEGCIDLGEIVGANKAVLVPQQGANQSDSQQTDPAEVFCKVTRKLLLPVGSATQLMA